MPSFPASEILQAANHEPLCGNEKSLAGLGHLLPHSLISQIGGFTWFEDFTNPASFDTTTGQGWTVTQINGGAGAADLDSTSAGLFGCLHLYSGAVANTGAQFALPRFGISPIPAGADGMWSACGARFGFIPLGSGASVIEGDFSLGWLNLQAASTAIWDATTHQLQVAAGSGALPIRDGFLFWKQHGSASLNFSAFRAMDTAATPTTQIRRDALGIATIVPMPSGTTNFTRGGFLDVALRFRPINTIGYDIARGSGFGSSNTGEVEVFVNEYGRPSTWRKIGSTLTNVAPFTLIVPHIALCAGTLLGTQAYVDHMWSYQPRNVL